MSILGICEWIDSTAFSTAIRESIWVFPIIETAHLLGIAVSAGTILFVDLRLLGIGMKRERLSEVLEQLQPWTVSAFVSMAITGSLLFLSEAVKCYHSVFFRIKIAMLALAAVNAALFHWKVYPGVEVWDALPAAPTRARFAGAVSVTLWIGIIAMGRAIAYGK
ncbi:MAG: DUF6644 family protein [Bryobacteraceae bacterium]